MDTRVKGVALFAAGAGIGAGVALLFAPRAGKHTRARIVNTANRTRHRMEEMRDDLRLHMAEWLDETSEVIANNIDACKEKTTEGGERVREVLGKVRERLDEGKERVEAYIRSVAG